MKSVFRANRRLSAGEWAIVYAAVAVYRLALCAQPPTESGDLFRHLGWASHFLERGPDLYRALPSDFAPELWTRIWTEHPYVYPPGALLFFAPFAVTGLGLFFAKAALTCADALTALLVWRLAGPTSGLLLFSAPAAMWYTSHEGQYDGLLNVWLLGAMLLVRRQRWMAAGAAWSVALQLKQFAALMLPYFIFEMAARAPGMRGRAAARLALGCLLTAILFAPFYAAAPDLWIRPVGHNPIAYNPFHWNLIDPSHYGWNPAWLVLWNGAFTYGILICLAVWGVRQAALVRVLSALPAASFWSLLKTLNWAQFWYVNSAPGLTLPLYRDPRILRVLLVLYWLQCGRSIALLGGAVFGYWAPPELIDRFEACLWWCDYRG